MSGRVLITGATSGIGRQLALDYRRAGWQVWGCGRDEVRLQALADLGITLCDSMRATAPPAEVAAGLPALDLLILNAGNCEYMDPAEGFDGALFARVIETNFVATGHAWLPCCRGWGRVDGLPSSAPR
jgi:NAD(P)-dependent dehydrogenase (short-subunit alcohol dehydrogenase family)